ncbi:hypothetical protein [Pseudomonas sp. ICMP 561]|uniref:hypothetical protein n=1 Tax=Pseudomonas sp. ICMP 561 TaxID=1718918 RepID=UPI000C082466|nr:hypothetical protein [Pseudomonas sp. ICMP 561]PHN32682.1 hypothetical protein AO242_08440 [Pseudomonas sp. ICMP 561]
MDTGINAATCSIATTPDRRLMLLLLLFCLPVTLLLLSILVINGGTLMYTLDDPYIHIDLARRIFSGHYGINPGEYSAPSSSILWPFLLAPFTPLSGLMLWVPLLLNIGFSFLTFSLFNRLLSGISSAHRFFILGGWFLATNFYGLIFNGMEHCLQIYLVAVIAVGVLRKEFYGKQITSNGVYLAILLLPLVRYEGLAVSLPVLLYLLCKSERLKPLVCGVALVGIVALFSLFLARLGVGYLPSSVIAKSDTTGLSSIVMNAIGQFEKYGWIILAMLVMCAFMPNRKLLVMLLITVTALHTLFGKNGWFGRYEIYWLTFLGVFFLHLCLTHLKARTTAIIFGLLPLAFAQLVYTTLSTPLASAAVYNQQYPMSQIAQRLNAPVAVNDLGLVALNSRQYVLDLWGLGNLEALKLRKSESGPQWIKDLMDRKNVHYAFVYEEWFPERPDNWIKVGELQMHIPKIATAFNHVAFYATDEQSAQTLREVMQAYALEQPTGKYEFWFEN